MTVGEFFSIIAKHIEEHGEAPESVEMSGHDAAQLREGLAAKAVVLPVPSAGYFGSVMGVDIYVKEDA